MIDCGVYNNSSYLFFIPESDRSGYDPIRLECLSLYVTPPYIEDLNTGNLVYAIVPKEVDRDRLKVCSSDEDIYNKYKIFSHNGWSLITWYRKYNNWRVLHSKDLSWVLGRAVQYVSKNNEAFNYWNDYFSDKIKSLRRIIWSDQISWIKPIWDINNVFERPMYFINRKRALACISMVGGSIQKGRVYHWLLEKEKELSLKDGLFSLEPKSYDDYGVSILDSSVDESSYESYIGNRFELNGIYWQVNRAFEPEKSNHHLTYEVRSENGFISFIQEKNIESPSEDNLFWNSLFKNDLLSCIEDNYDQGKEYLSLKRFDRGKRTVARYKCLNKDEDLWSLRREVDWDDWVDKKKESEVFNDDKGKLSKLKEIDNKIKKEQVEKLKKLYDIELD